MKKAQALRIGKQALTLWETNDPDSLEKARNIGPNTFRALRSKRFLAEYCWVIYASGFRYAVIESVFPSLTVAFKNFNLDAISRMRSVQPALKVFNNERKAKNFLEGAQAISNEGFSNFKLRLKRHGIDALEELPGIGPITKSHLAKNIGLADVAKPDIWLVRAAFHCGAKSVTELVTWLSEELGESHNVVDIALWQYGKDGYLPKPWA